MPPRETENKANNAKFWGDKQRALSLVCYGFFWSGQLHGKCFYLMYIVPVIFIGHFLQMYLLRFNVRCQKLSQSLSLQYSVDAN